MTTVSRSFTVTARPDLVVPYLADFGNAEEWDPGTQRCTRRDSGPVRVGATWQNTSRLAGHSTELTYTLEGLSDHQIVLVGRNDSATSTETIDVLPEGEGSSITYTNDLVFHGAAKLATPLGKILMEKLGHDTEKQMTDVLNRLGQQA